MAFPSDSARTKDWGTEVLTDADLEAQLDLLHNYFLACLNSSTGHSHDGTSNQGPKINITNLTVSSQAQGDIIYASSSSAWARLGAGTSGQYLKTQGAGANPTWATLIATQAEMESASSTTVCASPGRTQYHPGVAKAWIIFDGTSGSIGTGAASHNVSSVTDNGTGDYTISFTTSFSSSNFCAVGSAYQGSGPVYCTVNPKTYATGSVRVEVADVVSDSLKDATNVNVVCYGDQS